MDQIFKWLGILGRMSNLYADQQFKDLQINSSQHMFLVHICKNPGITQDRLKESFFIHPSNITRALDHLEREGYIIKEPLETDKRTFCLHPTERAREAYDYILRVIWKWESIITSEMTEEQEKEFAALLEQAGKKAIEYFFC